ncbi:PSD1 and planctomycete cytochrome C domain-containing protein [Botrimarina colliarenosi]|uniref:PSD1 and planctomycete cytochrome C domain-containing protein n=1 Tax=Botrimarina colliarenosi TaxID=2528001 RepID=UPI001E36DA92|nr:PSD1 and planctomycete cytochrome C domain-containing protein [Botrimarina colliarenosi]
MASLPLTLRADEPLVFDRDIRPILSDNCFLCHGPDESSRATDLRLDSRESATADLGGYAAVTPGDSAESELVRRILSTDEYEQMPPPDSNKSLSPAEIERLRRWVDEGAPWTGHWAFTAPQRPAVPEVSESAPAGWDDNPIDAFVLRRLDETGLSPSPSADRQTLLRRVTLDLTGLPPTLAERDAFLADRRPDAYERLVERLLVSPHYGERWGQKWLDAARYADSDGYEKDKQRTNWFYRDWVVDALNMDKPYDEFLIEQVAGDLLPGAGQDELVATGFLRNSMVNEEGGADPEQFRIEGLFDRVDAIGKAVLGITTQCAQCHTHKYDPISHDEYYGLFAYLNNCHEATIAVYTDAELREIEQIERDVASIKADLKSSASDWRNELVAWAQSVRATEVDWTPVRVERENFTGEKFDYLDDLSVLSRGFSGSPLTADMATKPAAGSYSAVRVEFLTHPTLPRGGPGRSIYGTHALTEFRCFYTAPDGQRTQLKLVSASSDIDPPDQPMEFPFIDTTKEEDERRLGPIEYAIDEDLTTGWHTNGSPATRNRDHKAVFVLSEPIAVEPGGTLTFRLKQDHGGWNPNDNHTNIAGRYRFSLTKTPEPEADPLPREVREIIGRSPESWSESEWGRVFDYWRTTRSEWVEANRAIAERLDGFPEGTLQCVTLERDEARVTHLLERGNFLTLGQVIEPHTPAFLHPTPEGAPATRLTLARWLASRDSPTTARALVNRVWQAYFGTGLVETPEDLGSQSPPPSHPQLLDWLAVEFMDSGWKPKHLHRLIVTSATYRQASRMTPKHRERDPNNRLLARASRLRVDAESVRDIALAASGLLDPAIGGPAVYPPAPRFLFLPPASYGPKPWNLSKDAQRYRRSLYVQKYRSTPYPTLQVFDAPTGAAACVRRSRSNTPVQALTLLNEQQFVECAQAMASRLIAADESDESRIERAFVLAVSRPPTAAEATTLGEYLRSVRSEIAAGTVDAAAVSGAEEHSEELAAWTLVARCLLNLDETITRQ